MKDIHYAFCVAKIRALESLLLTKEDIALLISQKDLSAALSFLRQKSYAKEQEGINEIINRHTSELNEVLTESVPDKNALKALFILNDYFNLKVLVKCLIEKAEPAGLFAKPTSIDFSSLGANASEQFFSDLTSGYGELARQAYDIALKSENGKFCDVIIDTAAINALSSYAKTKNSGILGKICAFLADTANIKAALRCAFTSQSEDYIKEAIGNCCYLDKELLIKSTISGEQALVSYLDTTEYKNGVEVYLEKPSNFEKWCDDCVIKIASDAVYTSFGFDPVVYYYYSKSLEIRTVRMILTAIKSDIDKATIKERVRELYA